MKNPPVVSVSVDEVRNIDSFFFEHLHTIEQRVVISISVKDNESHVVLSCPTCSESLCIAAVDEDV